MICNITPPKQQSIRRKYLTGMFAASLLFASPVQAGKTSGTDTSPAVNDIPSAALDIQGDDITKSGRAIDAVTLDATGDAFANDYFLNADERLRTDIKTVDGLDTIEKLQGVSFNWKKDGTPSAGIVAQDVEKVMPSAVRVNGQGYKTVEYDQLMAPMIEAIKELKRRNDEQAAELRELRKKIEK
jgi:Chaperone of endosialidase